MRKLICLFIVASLLIAWTPAALAENTPPPNPQPTTLDEYVKLQSWFLSEVDGIIKSTNGTRIAMLKTVGLPADARPHPGDYELLKQAYPRTIKLSEDAWEEFAHITYYDDIGRLHSISEPAEGGGISGSGFKDAVDGGLKLIQEGPAAVAGLLLEPWQTIKDSMAYDLIGHVPEGSEKDWADQLGLELLKELQEGPTALDLPARLLRLLDVHHNYDKYAAQKRALIQSWERILKKGRDDGRGSGSGGGAGGGGHGSGGGGAGGIPNDPCPLCHGTITPTPGGCRMVQGLDGQWHLECGPPKKKGD